jgi:hypothetical protein
MDEKIEAGVNVRIEVKKNLGNYNQATISLEGSREEIAAQMPSTIALLKGLSMAVNDEMGTNVSERPTTGDSEPSSPPERGTTTAGARGDGQAAVIEPWPSKGPLPNPPEDTGEEFKGRGIYECTHCHKRNAMYVGKKGKSAGKNCWSCSKDYGGCGAWYVWEEE